MLSDAPARVPEYALDSPLSFPGYDVAVKTGTTDDTRDAWVIGYTPSIALGVWAGNNDNTPMVKINCWIYCRTNVARSNGVRSFKISENIFRPSGSYFRFSTTDACKEIGKYRTKMEMLFRMIYCIGRTKTILKDLLPQIRQRDPQYCVLGIWAFRILCFTSRSFFKME